MEAHDCNFHEVLGRCINDRCILHRAMRALAKNLAAVAFGERCFELGSEHGSWREDPYPDWEPWKPGTGHSADHECKDCGVPMLTDDVSQGFKTCEQCAAERRAAR